jgi:hypothetical protein
MMESWHRALASALSLPVTDGGAELESAFGNVRSVVVYVLELGRAHRLAATGNVLGDDVWLALGQGSIRFTLNRREEVIQVRSLGGEQRLTWNRSRGSLVDPNGAAHDLTSIVRGAIDELVAHWRSYPAQRFSNTPSRELDDEPTKG